MSVKALGIFELTSTIAVEQRTEIAFWMTKEAINNKIGINLGANVFCGWLDANKFDQNEVRFEITDDPLDINAEVLFLGDGIKYSVCDHEVDTSESLLSRMNRVQSFIEKLLQHPLARKVILGISDEGGENDYDEELECKVQDFSTTMIDLYKKSENWTPDVRLIVTK